MFLGGKKDKSYLVLLKIDKLIITFKFNRCAQLEKVAD